MLTSYCLSSYIMYTSVAIPKKGIVIPVRLLYRQNVEKIAYIRVASPSFLPIFSLISSTSGASGAGVQYPAFAGAEYAELYG